MSELISQNIQPAHHYFESTDMTDAILSDIRQYITSQILKQPNLPIAADEALISSGLIDSFSLVDLALYIEDSYGVRIDDTELNADTFDTLNQLAALISQRQS